MRLEDINLRNPISIAYYDPFSVFSEIRDEFTSKFPLSNLHWKYNPLKPGKSIPLLPVELKEEVPPLPHKKNTQKVPLADNVYLRLMFVKADNVDMYRSQVRPLIAAWLESLIKGKDVARGIVLVIPSSKRDKPLTLIKSSLYDKLKTDFGKSGKHLATLDMAASDLESSREEYDALELSNIFKLRAVYADEYQKLHEYSEVIAQVKTLILQTFDTRYTAYNETLDLVVKLAQADAEARVAHLLHKLRLVYLMSDMRFLKESLDLYDELFEDVKIVVADSNHAFDKQTLRIPAEIDLNNFSPESAFDHNDLLDQLAKYTQQNVPINLFDAKLGLFVGASLLLQSLANFATSISISSIYILTLLLRLSHFINDVSRSYPNSTQLSEWFCAMIDFHLNLPLTAKLVELNEKKLEASDINHTAAILEYLAELKLLRRTIVSKLAQKKGLKLPQLDLILYDVLLDSEETSSEEVELSYKPLIAQLEDQKSFESYFESSTISAIEDFVKCERNKTIDILSVDLAILHYQRKEYQEALEILLTSHEYFIENNWNFMGGALLEIYLECIQKVDTYSHEEILKSNLKLLATLRGGKINTIGINNFTLVKNEQQRRALFERIQAESHHLDFTLTYPLSDLFTATMASFIDTKADSGDQYAISIEVTNPLGVDIVLQEVRAILEREDTRITFSTAPVTLTPGTQTLSLFSLIFSKGKFQVKSIELQVTERLVFEQKRETLGEAATDNTVIHAVGELTTSNSHRLSLDVLQDTPSIEMYPVPGKFRVEAQSPLEIELGVARFDLVIYNGHQDATNINVSLSSLTPGVKFTKHEPEFAIEALQPDEIHRKSITFDYFGDTKILALQLDVIYESNGTIYEFHTNEAYDMSLTISISVQDIFRSEAIFSKFQIGSVSTKIPVRVLDCDFKSSDGRYDISSLSVSVTGSELLVFGDQPAYVFYKLEPKSGKVSPSDVLDLTITYSNLQNECEKLASNRFLEKLSQLGLANYFYAVAPSVKSLKFNLFHYALHLELEVLDVEASSLVFDHSIRKLVPPLDAEQMKDILTDIFKGRKLAVDNAEVIENQQLHIPVAVPSLGMFHKLEFLFDRKPRYLVGEPIEATLEITSTSKWATQESQEILASSSPSRQEKKVAPQEYGLFQFSFLGEEQWLITGFKKHQFDVKGETSSCKFDVCLVPLNVGAIQLPKLNIKPMASIEQQMEIVHENALETVLVVPELDSITFSF